MPRLMPPMALRHVYVQRLLALKSNESAIIFR